MAADKGLVVFHDSRCIEHDTGSGCDLSVVSPPVRFLRALTLWPG